jgi:hypothetical protein
VSPQQLLVCCSRWNPQTAWLDYLLSKQAFAKTRILAHWEAVIFREREIKRVGVEGFHDSGLFWVVACCYFMFKR